MSFVMTGFWWFRPLNTTPVRLHTHTLDLTNIISIERNGSTVSANECTCILRDGNMFFFSHYGRLLK